MDPSQDRSSPFRRYTHRGWEESDVTTNKGHTHKKTCRLVFVVRSLFFLKLLFVYVLCSELKRSCWQSCAYMCVCRCEEGTIPWCVAQSLYPLQFFDSGDDQSPKNVLFWSFIFGPLQIKRGTSVSWSGCSVVMSFFGGVCPLLIVTFGKKIIVRRGMM